MKEITRQRSDADLIQACLDGDDSAWQSLVMRYKRLVFSVPIRWGLSSDDAVDVFQAVWLDCFRQLASVRNVDRLQPWLIRVAIRKCHRLSQAIRARQEDPLEPEEGEPAWVGPDPVRFGAQLDRDQVIRDAIDRLTGKCRQVLQLLFFEEPRPTYQAIAARLGLSENSIGFTRERCLKSMRRALDELGYDHDPGR
jgi:RNA polymerase sigma factor (sigma-70 family)